MVFVALNGLRNNYRAVATGLISTVSAGPLFPLPWLAWRRQIGPKRRRRKSVCVCVCGGGGEGGLIVYIVRVGESSIPVRGSIKMLGTWLTTFARQSGWMKVWDYALDRGSSDTNRALAVLKLVSAPVYGDRRCMLSSCQLPVESIDTMIDHFIKENQEITPFPDADKLLSESAYLRTHFSIWVNQ